MQPILLLSFVSLASLVILLKKAPFGYEDKDGFHLRKDKSDK